MARILLIDDEPAVRYVVSELLTARGHLVAVASDVEAGWWPLQRAVFDLAIIDAGLPGMGGAELIRRVRASRRSPTFGLSSIPGTT